jgi:hypothetical protein
MSARRIAITLTQIEINAAVNALITRKLVAAGIDISGGDAASKPETYFMALIDPPMLPGATLSHRSRRDGSIELLYAVPEIETRGATP